MKRLHPNRRCTALTAGFVVAICVVGCRGPQTPVSNPFLAPDRVPPPSTRMIAPGTAQPYYPGDPLPAVHSSTPAPAPTPTAVAAQQVAPNVSPASATTPTFSPPSSRAIAASEPSVAIPVDENRLRFALPTPPPPAPANVPAPAAQPNVPTLPTAPVVVAAPQNSSPVVAAVYNDDPYHVAPASAGAGATSGPWRPPQIPRPGLSPAPAPSPLQNTQPMAMQSMPAVVPPTTPSLVAQAAPGPTAVPAATAAPMMPVFLRAVPSPAAEPVISQPPRIRFPSAVASSAPPNAAAGGVVQTVQATELPPSVALAPAAPSTPVSPDGFRPRGSVR